MSRHRTFRLRAGFSLCSGQYKPDTTNLKKPEKQGLQTLMSNKVEEKNDSNPVVITKKGENDSLRIDQDALRRMLMRPDIGDKPIAIISVTGSMRTGKSFLLNFFVRYFREKGWKNSDWIHKDGGGHTSGNFPWKGGATRCTTGIQLLSEPFEVPMKEGGSMIVLLMDTQGLFDNQTPENVNKTLLTLGTMASSVQIFNAKDNINSSNLQYLKTCVDFALATAKAEQAGGYLKLQQLLFVVRDFPEDDEESTSYTLRSGDDYLYGILNSTKGGDEQIRVRRGIKDSFEDVRCFVLPHPGLRVTKAKFGGTNSELEEDFLECVKTLVEEVTSPTLLMPKRSKDDKFLNARQLLNVLTACDNTFAQKLFEASNVMEANEKAHYASAYEEAIAEYTKVLESRLEGNEEVDEKQMKTIHKEVKNHAIKRYARTLPMGTGEHEVRYREHLEKKCEEHFQLVFEQRKVEQTTKATTTEKKERQVVTDYERMMQDYLFENSDKFQKGHEKCFAEICKRYEKYVNERELVEMIEQHYQQLKRNNSEHQKQAIEAMKEERKQKLHELVAITLRRKCTKKWDEVVKGHPDDAQMNGAFEKMKEEIESLFWKKSLTKVESKYKNVLDDKINGAVDNWKKKGKVNIAFPWTSSEAGGVKLPDSERLHHARVEEIMDQFAMCLNKVKLRGTSPEKQELDEIEDLKCLHRRMYFGWCSEHIMSYYNLLRNDIMDEEYRKAQGKKERNWELFVIEVDTAIEAGVLELEKDLEQQMQDRHFDEKELEKHYEMVEKEMIKERPEELNVFLSRSKVAKKEFERRIRQKIQESLGKMKRENEDNRAARLVTDSELLTKKRNFFQKAWDWLKSLWPN